MGAVMNLTWNSKDYFIKSHLRSSYLIFINPVLMFNFIVLTSSRRARGCPWKKKFEKMSNFLAYNTPRPPMSVHKNCSPIGPAVRSAIRNICIYECLVLLYR